MVLICILQLVAALQTRISAVLVWLQISYVIQSAI